MINCPKCGGDTEILLTRTTSDNQNRRKRRCMECLDEFFTMEVHIVEVPKTFNYYIQRTRWMAGFKEQEE